MIPELAEYLKSEIQQIVRDYEAKYLAEHEKVRKWREEQGME